MELIKIYNGSLVNARDLWIFLEIKTPFSIWIKRMLEYGFEVNKDYFTTNKKVSRQILKEFYLTIQTAKEISMVQRTEKGREARLYFIKCEETLQELAKNKRLETFFKLEATKERLLKNVESVGGTHEDFIQIDYEGRKVFFNGEPMPDEQLPLVLMKGRDFATEMTNEQFKEGDIKLEDIEKLNSHHHDGIRQMLIDNVRKKPEEFVPEENIKKLK